LLVASHSSLPGLPIRSRELLYALFYPKIPNSKNLHPFWGKLRTTLSDQLELFFKMKIPSRLLEKPYDEGKWKQIEDYLSKEKEIDSEVLVDHFANSTKVSTDL
jgi:hypothetical protein